MAVLRRGDIAAADVVVALVLVGRNDPLTWDRRKMTAKQRTRRCSFRTKGS